METRKRYSMLTLMLFAVFASNAFAVDIETHFIGGEPPANAAGGGNLNDIMNVAARIWASAYSDSMTLTIHYGWAELGDAATHTLTAQSVNPVREVAGTILFNNSGAAPFYLDPTPEANEEYGKLTEESQNLGGGFANVARVYSNAAGDAVNRIDLLSVALHEIGHALGMSVSNLSFIEQSETGVIHIANDLPFRGTTVPLAYNNLGVVAHFDVTEVAYGSVMAGINGDERRMPSELDVIVNAQISSFTVLSLHPQINSQSGGTGTLANRGSRRSPDSRGIPRIDRSKKTDRKSGLPGEGFRLRTK